MAFVDGRSWVVDRPFLLQRKKRVCECWGRESESEIEESTGRKGWGDVTRVRRWSACKRNTWELCS